jgi:hypothetical protein
MIKLQHPHHLQKSHVDPIKLNRGQVIHFEERKEPYKPRKQGVSEGVLSVKQKNTSHTINLDWFAQTLTNDTIPLRGGEIEVSEGVHLIQVQGRTKHYDLKYEVYLFGQSFATLLAQPRAEYVQPNRVEVKVHNHLLYTEGWLDDYKYILSETGWRVVSNTRTDIAIDGAHELMRMCERSFKSRVIKRKGRARWKCESDNKSNAIKKVEIGSMHSDKYGKVYPKVEEVESSGKDYIKQFWKRNGLEVKGDMPRYEMTMRAKVGNNYDWERFDDPEYLASIMRTESKNWCDFYYDGRDKNKHRKYKSSTMQYINWTEIGGDLLEKQRVIRAKSYLKAKMSIKFLAEEHYKGSDDHTKTIYKLLSKYSLEDWYDKKLSYWLDDWTKEQEFEDKIQDLLNLCSN